MRRLMPRTLYRGLLEEYRTSRPDLPDYQRRQMAYAKSYEPGEQLGGSREFHCTCRTCNEAKVFKAADTVRLWINRHAGHRTWLDVVH